MSSYLRDTTLETDPERPFLANFVVGSPLFPQRNFRKEAFADRLLERLCVDFDAFRFTSNSSVPTRLFAQRTFFSSQFMKYLAISALFFSDII